MTNRWRRHLAGAAIDPLRPLWVWAEFDAPTEALWQLLVDPEAWPRWGPSVRSAVVESGELGDGATGTVTTTVGVTLPFRITAFEPGARWAWSVGGVPATDHRVEPLGPRRCRVGFGVAWPAAPYLVVAKFALIRLGRLVGDP